MKIIDVIEKTRPFPWAHIDTGFRQGRDAVLEQFRQQLDQENKYTVDRNATVDQFLSAMQNDIADLVKRAAPHDLPEDYLFFLKHYGGLAIDGINCNFSIYGIGPMVETWYGYINSGDHVLLESGKLGWQTLGYVVFRTGHKYEYQRILFYLDLAGSVQKNCVIGVGPWNGVDPPELKILNNIHAYPNKWRIIAQSFTDWLKQAIETRGAFVYT